MKVGDVYSLPGKGHATWEVVHVTPTLALDEPQIATLVSSPGRVVQYGVTEAWLKKRGYEKVEEQA